LFPADAAQCIVAALTDPLKSVHSVPHGIRQDRSYIREAEIATAMDAPF
jgi:hypothetical protein